MAASLEPVQYRVGKQLRRTCGLSRHGYPVTTPPADRDPAGHCPCRGALLLGSFGQGVHGGVSRGGVGQPGHVRQHGLPRERPGPRR